jgi:hypothetical protein
VFHLLELTADLREENNESNKMMIISEGFVSKQSCFIMIFDLVQEKIFIISDGFI